MLQSGVMSAPDMGAEKMRLRKVTFPMVIGLHKFGYICFIVVNPSCWQYRETGTPVSLYRAVVSLSSD